MRALRASPNVRGIHPRDADCPHDFRRPDYRKTGLYFRGVRFRRQPFGLIGRVPTSYRVVIEAFRLRPLRLGNRADVAPRPLC